MNVTVIYRSESEHGRSVDDFLRDFQQQTGKELTTASPDEREGESLCRTYDIVEYPTIIAISDNGQLQNSWRGLPLPTINEVSYYSK